MYYLRSYFMENKKLQAKDLINVGLFTALYFVLFFACSMLGYIPFLLPTLGCICAIVAGIPFMLYLTRVNKFGMVTISGVIVGLLMMIMGGGLMVLISGVVFGFLADLVLRAGKYQSLKHTLIGYGVFSLWVMGLISHMFLTRAEYFAELAVTYGQEYVDTLMMLTPEWSFPLLFVITFLGGILGGLLGRAVLKKHFVRAGIA